jgi:DNA-binding CsgD family transcriptional regulator
LTPREREVVQLTAAGKSAWEISVILSISQHTVKHHLRVAAAKLDATNKVATVVQAVRRREITL